MEFRLNESKTFVNFMYFNNVVSITNKYSLCSSKKVYLCLNWIRFALNSRLHHVSGLQILTFRMKTCRAWMLSQPFQRKTFWMRSILFLKKPNDLNDCFTIQSKESSLQHCRSIINSIVLSFQFYIHSYFNYLQLPIATGVHNANRAPLPINRRTWFKLKLEGIGMIGSKSVDVSMKKIISNANSGSNWAWTLE